MIIALAILAILAAPVIGTYLNVLAAEREAMNAKRAARATRNIPSHTARRVRARS